MKLISLTMNNFLSHRNSVIEFDHYEGTTLIEGRTEDGHYTSNGSGKSTILEGVYYAITGKTLRGLTVDQVVNNISKKDTEVSLVFSIGKDLYKISRYRKHSEQGNNVLLYKNSNDISDRLSADTQSKIDSIVNIPVNILSGLLVLGEGLSSRFTALSDQDKKTLLESTINTDMSLSEIQDRVKSKLKELQSSISNLEGQMTANSRMRVSYDIDQSISKEVLIRELSDLEESKRSLLESNVDRSSEQSRYMKSISLIDTTLSNTRTLKDRSLRLNTEVNRLSSDMSSITGSIPTCPTCKQTLKDPEEVYKSYEDNLISVKSELSKVEEELSRLPEESILLSKKKDLHDTLRSIEDSYSRFNLELNRVSSEITRVTSMLTILDQKDKVLRDLESSDSKLSSEISDLKSLLGVYSYYDKTLFNKNGLIVYILKSVISIINKRISVYTSQLMESNYYLVFNKGKLTLESDNGKSYSSLSNGEKKRLDISIQFALHDYIYAECGIGFDTLFIDEILDTLDEVGVSNIVEVLSIKKRYCNLDHIFIVTHNEEFKDYFDSTLSVYKDLEGFTIIEEV